MFYLNYFFVFFSLIYASYTDLKKREVSNYLSLFLFIFGVVFNLIFSTLVWWKYLLFVVIAFLVIYLLWHLGVFAGGDAKLYIAIAANIPFQTFAIINVFGFGKIPFVLSLFVLSVFVVFPYGLFLLFGLLIKQKKLKVFFNKDLKRKFISILESAVVFISLLLILLFFSLPLYLALPLSILAGFIPRKIKLFVAIPLFLIVLFINPLLNVKIIFSFLVSGLLLWFFLKLFELFQSGIFNITKKLKDLKEGDVLAYAYYLENNSLKPYKKLTLKEFWEFTKKNYKTPQKILNLLKKQKALKRKLVINNKFASGIEEKDILILKKYFDDKQNIELKQTMPLVPTILISYVLLILLGDILWYLTMGL